MSFNRDRAITARFFAHDPMLHVTSCFYSLQGEGQFLGHPAVFLRLAGCNFGAKAPDGFCQFCDSSFQIDRAKKLTPEHVADLVCDVLGDSTAELLVITGGEPTLQSNILDVLRILHERDMFSLFQFETNGTSNPAFLAKLESLSPELASKITFCVSPKASYKTGEYSRLSPKLKELLVAGKGFLKFVVDAVPGSPHHKLPEWVDELVAELVPVYVSPMTVYSREPVGEVSSVWNRELVDHEATSINYGYAAQYVMTTPGLRFTCQTHLFTAVP